MVDKAQRAKALGEKASELADVGGRQNIQLGLIALEFRDDPELVELDGCRTYNEWMERRFGKRRKTAYRWRAIVERLLQGKFASEVQLLEWGSVKSYELSRLPESQLKTGEWQLRASTEFTAQFKLNIANYLADTGGDHREPPFIVRVVMPESFADVWKDTLKSAWTSMEREEGLVSDSVPEAVEYVCSQFLLEHGNTEVMDVTDDGA